MRTGSRFVVLKMQSRLAAVLQSGCPDVRSWHHGSVIPRLPAHHKPESFAKKRGPNQSWESYNSCIDLEACSPKKFPRNGLLSSPSPTMMGMWLNQSSTLAVWLLISLPSVRWGPGGPGGPGGGHCLGVACSSARICSHLLASARICCPRATARAEAPMGAAQGLPGMMCSPQLER